ncbi:MAG: type II toxin-antitoxin system RelE/ParE family toxin [Magnetococcales bacterium]|nr:type II toxin-antitoxin system RelE/ParE family toxin [Magnetococcales bacterium]
MGWTVEIGARAEKQLLKLDAATRTRILNYLAERLEGCKDPRHFGEALKGDKAGGWRYRVGSYRLLCDIQDQRLILVVMAVGHRREVYRS